jgi:hypothetical protein
MDDQARKGDGLARLLRSLDEYKGKEVYVFMDEQDGVLDSDWFASDRQALAHARTLARTVVNVLRHVACADNDEECYDVFGDPEARLEG